jgi:hypothetical protein
MIIILVTVLAVRLMGSQNALGAEPLPRTFVSLGDSQPVENFVVVGVVLLSVLLQMSHPSRNCNWYIHRQAIGQNPRN